MISSFSAIRKQFLNLFCDPFEVNGVSSYLCQLYYEGVGLEFSHLCTNFHSFHKFLPLHIVAQFVNAVDCVIVFAHTRRNQIFRVLFLRSDVLIQSNLLRLQEIEEKGKRVSLVLLNNDIVFIGHF